MRRIAPATLAVVTSMATPLVANAEPIELITSQMESVTAAAPNVSVNVAVGGVLVQTNITTQVANAIATAIATCGVCNGNGPTASSLAAAVNANVSGLIQQ